MRTPISIVHFTSSTVLGGAEQHLLTLLCGINRDTFRVSVVCPDEVAIGLGNDLPNEVAVIPLAFKGITDWRSAIRLAKVLRQLRTDILHSHMFHSSLLASPVGWFARVPVIIETPHINERWRHGLIKGRFIVDRLAGNFVDYYIAVSEANARYLHDEKGLKARKIVVIPNSCDVRKFSPNRTASAALKSEWRITESDQILVVLARLEPQKGHDILLDSMVAITKEYPRTRLFLVGEGASRGALQAKTRELKLESVVHFTGYRRNVEEWMAVADVVVLPSRWEGMPLVAIEALAAGKAIVATAVDGTPEVVLDGECGFVVPPADSNSMATAIIRLLKDPSLRRAFGDAGRRRALEHFDSSLQVERTERLYTKALESSSRKPRYGHPRGATTSKATKHTAV